MWTWNFPSQLAQDTRFAFRTMASKPVFTAMAVLSLALGIGANTAIYSFMDAILMRTIPVPHPSQLAVFNWRATGRSPFPRRISGTGHREPNGGVSSPNYPYAAYEMFRANTDVLSSVVAYAWTRDLTVIARQQAESAAGLFVSGNFYAGLGVVPAAGRLIDADDDRLGAPPVAVIGYQYWQRRFGCDPSAVGLSILIDNTPFTIVGVSAPGFSGVDHAVEPLFFLPIHAEPLFSTEPAADVERRFFDKNYYWLEMIGRLRPGVSLERAQSALALRFSQFVGSHAATAANRAAYPALFLQEGATGLDSLRRAYSKPVYILMAMVGLILVIACANIANLLLARAASRRREMAVRLSLGAGRWRVVRQLLTESAALASMGGLLGVLVAVWGIRTITWLLANGRDDFHLRATIDWPVLGFTLALTVLTGIVFGLAPALQATRVDLTPALKQARASAPRRRSGLRLGLGQTLVVVQIAISLLLVVGAGLFVHTLSNLHSIPLGFNSENVLVFNLNARQAGYRGDDSGRFYAGLKDRFRAIPGVRSVTFSGSPLVDFYWDSQGVFLPGAPETSGKPRETALVTADPSFLDTMQIPIVLGRGLEPRDLASPNVAVVNQKFASDFFGAENPVGRTFGLGDSRKFTGILIVGVAKAAHYNSLKEDIPAVAYVPYTQSGLGQAWFELRTAGDPLAFAGAVRQIVHRADPAIPVTNLGTQARMIEQTIGTERTFANLCSGFAALAMLIACVGLYGTVAYAVARRTAEIGIRMALGARQPTIVWMVLREVLALVTLGLAIGLAGAWETTRFVKAFLFDTKPNDPLAISIAVAILATAALLAGYGPAWQASRLDPMKALRQE